MYDNKLSKVVEDIDFLFESLDKITEKESSKEEIE